MWWRVVGPTASDRLLDYAAFRSLDAGSGWPGSARTKLDAVIREPCPSPQREVREVAQG